MKKYHLCLYVICVVKLDTIHNTFFVSISQIVETPDGVKRPVLPSSTQNHAKHEFFVVDLSPDENPCEVIPGLYIGSQDAASNFEGLQKNHITHILVVAAGISKLYPEVTFRLISV